MADTLKEWQERSRREVEQLRRMRVRVLGKMELDDLFIRIPEKPSWQSILNDFLDAVQSMEDEEQKKRIRSELAMIIAVHRQEMNKVEPFIIEHYEHIEKLEYLAAMNTVDQLVAGGFFKADAPLMDFLRQNDLQGLLEFLAQGGSDASTIS